MVFTFITIYNDDKKKKMIALKGAVPDFLQSPHCARELSQTRMLKWAGRSRVQITCNTMSAYHVQHVVCHMAQRDISANKIDRVEIVSI